MVCTHSQSVKLLTPASLLVLGVLMFYFVYQILFILNFLSSTSIPKAAAEPCSIVQCTAYTPKGHGQGSQLGHSPVLLLLEIIFLVQFIPGLCICFLVYTRTLQFIFKEDKEKKKIHCQATTHVLVHCYSLLPQLTFL